MRATLADPSLARYAGRFVWLELDFDKTANQDFLARHEVTYTPTMFVLNPADGRATATQLGGMTLAELTAFLERGERAYRAKSQDPAGAALARADELLARGQPAEAASAYSEALRLGGPAWTERNRVVTSHTWALMQGRQWQACAEQASAEAPHMPRGQLFGRVVLAGLSCASHEKSAPWAVIARQTLVSFAQDALAVADMLRDHRFQLYLQLMIAADIRADKAALRKWGDRWLQEIDSIHPSSNDERAGLDVSRVEAASALGDPARVLPALMASEKAMPNNYSSSLRLAQMELEARQFREAIAACDRGLLHVTGPLGRSWLLTLKAQALKEEGPGCR